jgi:hypothetical protein
MRGTHMAVYIARIVTTRPLNEVTRRGLEDIIAEVIEGEGVELEESVIVVSGLVA